MTRAMTTDGKISGWAWKIIDTAIKYSNGDVTWDDIVMFDDQCRVKNSPIISQCSTIRDTDRFVVWVKRQADGSYYMRHQAESGNFGGGSHYVTLDEVTAAFDRMRGMKPKQEALF